MDKLLFFNVCVSGLNLFIIVYAYSYKFFPKRWRNKVKQGTIIGLALIFVSMITMFSWIIYFYFFMFGSIIQLNFMA